ncbi:MAG TPA: hypothetical protein VGQ89_13185, partial [Candidatus Limnocylindrales bacterium]|nr:hypothetical protein [Candidatus Limnocylindrales bacterium]
MIRGRGLDRVRARATSVCGALAATLALSLAAPAAAAAHTLNPTYTSRLPLAVYLAGAATTVALSFTFVLVRDVRAERPPFTSEGHLPPAPLRFALRAIGLIAWGWIIAQGIAGGGSSAEVTTLFVWVYGWVGVAIICALVGPIWQFLDPFSTLYDFGAWVIRRIGMAPWEVAPYPAGIGRWPAVVGFAVVIWLELV